MKLTDSQLNAERSALACCIGSADKIGAMLDQGIGVEHFAMPTHKQIWQALSELYKTPEKCNVAGLTEKMEAANQEWHTVLPDVLANNYGFKFESSIGIIIEAKRKRDLEGIAHSMILKIDDPDVTANELLAETETLLSSARDVCGVAAIPRLSEGLDAVVNDIEFRTKNPGAVKGLQSDFYKLDRILDGLQETALIVIGARPGVGKTSFLTNILTNVASRGTPVGMFSLEMSRNQVLQRLLFGRAKINAASLRYGRALNIGQQKAFTVAVRQAKRLPFFVDERGAIRIDQIQATARRMVADHGVKCIGVDYLQLARPAGKSFSREREVSEISAGLKMIAKELNIPVIVLAQLNREAEKRAGKEAGVPKVSDLRDSGSIEQDADQIILLYRPSTNDDDANKEEAKAIVGKNRHGETGVINLKWDAAGTTFTEADL